MAPNKRWENLQFWNVTEQQIWELAGKNTPTLLPAKIRHISEWEEREGLTVKDRLDGRGRRASDSKAVMPLYLLSSKQGIYGTSCLLYDDLLQRFCEEKGYDSLLILPNGIHEVFLLPEENTFYSIYLKNAVKEGRHQETQREERLTDSIYRYECNNDRLIICG